MSEQIPLVSMASRRAPWPSGERSPTNADLNWLLAQRNATRDAWDAATEVANGAWRVWRAAQEAYDTGCERIRADGDEIVAVTP